MKRSPWVLVVLALFAVGVCAVIACVLRNWTPSTPPHDSLVADHEEPSNAVPPWRWSNKEATWDASVSRYLVAGEAERARALIFPKPPDFFHAAVFAREGGILYVARYCPIRTGCSVEAIDFATGQRVWALALEGIGPTDHSKYRNGVIVECDAGRVVVFGNEAHGRYVEILDARTGRQLGNQKFDADFKAWSD